MNSKEESVNAATFQRNPELIGASIDDEMVMMSIEHGQYYGMSGVAPRVWELLGEPQTLNELVEQMLEEFEVEREVCERDMIDFLSELEQLGLVERN